MIHGLPQIDRVSTTFSNMLEFLKNGKMPEGRNDRALMVEELEHWGLGDIETIKL